MTSATARHRAAAGGFPLAAVAALLLLAAIGAPPADAAGSPKISFYFGLTRPEGQARAAWAAVTDPGSSRYRRFASAGSVRHRYGASARTRKRLHRAARARGLRARVDPTGVFARISGPVRRMGRVFRVKVVRDDSDDPPLKGWVAKRRPKVPPAMKSLLREAVPMFNRSRTYGKASSLRRSPGPPLRAAAARPGNAGTWGTGCAAAKKTGGYSYDQVRTAYGIDALGAGEDASVAILNAGEGLTAANMRVAARCFDLPGLRPRTLLTDGQKRPFGLASFEPAMDLALVRGMAPAIRNVIFSQVWETPQLWFLGPSRLFSQRPLPDVLSVSYGECERQIFGRKTTDYTRGGARLFNSIVVRLGLAGVGTYAASGDDGSTCGGQPWAGVIWPASSPFVTAVGGTRLILDSANRRVGEVTWNDLPWLTVADGGGAGGGGFSAFQNRPAFQSEIPIPGTRRMVPDVSAHASALPGWPANLSTNWEAAAGTSASTPLVAAAMAIVSAGQRAAGSPPLGPASGLFYELAGRSEPPYFDVTAGDTGYSKKVPPRYARPGFDLATGIGVPRFDQIPALLGEG